MLLWLLYILWLSFPLSARSLWILLLLLLLLLQLWLLLLSSSIALHCRGSATMFQWFHFSALLADVGNTGASVAEDGILLTVISTIHNLRAHRGGQRRGPRGENSRPPTQKLGSIGH